MQDSTLSPQQLFLTNLRILSFPENQYTKYVHLPLSHDLFSRSSGNGKSFEFIAHFLFTKLDQDRALKSFRSCYPVADKTMAREFRNVVFKWCEELKGELKGECWVRRSFFDECRGERFERLLLAISNHVVQVVAGREYRHKIRPGTVLDVDSTRRLMSLDELKETLMNQVHIQSTQFLAEAQQQSLKQRLWNDTARKYLCQNDEFNTTIATLKEEFLNLTKEHSYLKKIESGAEAVDRMNDMIEKAKYLWKCLVEFMTQKGRDFEMIDKINRDEDFNHIIDGNQIKSQLAKQSTTFDQNKMMRNGDIQLSSLLKSGVEAVRCLQSSLNDSALTSLNAIDTTTDKMTKYITEQNAIFQNIQILQTKLQEQLEEVEASRMELKQRLNRNVEPGDLGYPNEGPKLSLYGDEGHCNVQAIKDISCGVKRIIASSNQIPHDKIAECVIGTRTLSLFHSRGKPAVKSAMEEVTLEQTIPSEVTEARENIAPFTAVTNSNLDQVTGKIPLKTRTNNVPITRSKDRLLNLKQSKVVESNVRTKGNKHLSTAVESNKRKLRPKTTAQEVLFEKILDYVTPATAHSHPSTPEALRRGQSGESPLADDYVVNPIEAMDSFGFIPKSEIARTPVKANSAKLGNKENQSTGLKSSAMTRTGSTKKGLELSPFKFHNESEMLLDETIPEFGVEDGSMLV